MNFILSKEDKFWGGGVHLAALIVALCTSMFAGVGGMIASLIVWFLRKENSPFIARHAAEAFNFNFSMFIYSLIAVLLAVFTLGFALIVIIPLALILAVVWFICSIIATMKGFDGEEYRYPFTIRLLK